MTWRVLCGIAVAWRLFLPVSGYGTTISIGIVDCPATYTSSSTSSTSSTTSATSSASATPTITPSEPVYLTFSLGGFPEYLTANGTVTNDIEQAASFAISPSGQLTSGSNYVSTSGDVSSQPFAASPETPLMKRLPRIFTLFSIIENDVLVWTNDVFVGGQAIFCISGSTLVVVFNAVPPQDCLVVQIGVVPTENSTPSTTSSATVVSQTSTISTSTTSVPRSSSDSTPTISTSTLSSTASSASTSGSVGSVSTTASTPDSSSSPSGTSASSPSSSGVASSSSSHESSSTPVTSSTTISAYPAPTTTGTPNCFDRSPFDGTVNNDYLILCDTDLPGFDLDAVAASDIAECIDACTSFAPGSQGPCVAVEFDILASTDPCHLKFDIGTVSRGANSFAQAAIVVNKPDAPNIVFSDEGVSSSSTSSSEPSTVISTTSTTTTAVSTFTSSSSAPSDNPTTSVFIQPTSSTQQDLPSTTTTPDVIQSSISSAVAGTSSQAEQTSQTSLSFIPASSSVPNTTPTSQQQSSTLSTSSTSNTPGSSFSPSSSVNPPSSSPGSSSPTSSTISVSVSPPSTSSPATTSLSTSRSSLSPVAPSPTSSASTTVTFVSTTAVSYCSATPTTTSLCSTYNHQALNVNSDGYCYEVECATALQGSILTGNSTTATSLKNCVGFCTNYNVALPFGCVGVSYLGSSSGSGPNCLLLSGITGTMSNPNIDSARLLYAGYPSINDPIFTPTSTTTQAPVSSPSTPSSSLAASPSTTASTTSYVPATCSAAPTESASACPGNSPACYSYNFLGNNANFEIECATAFAGSTGQPLLTFDLTDCINQCQYANALRANSCLGVTFMVTEVSQGSTNNCFPYSTLTCATRGNATFNSARMLYAGYPQMTDYDDPSFVCGGSGATTSATGVASSSSAGTSRASTTTSSTRASSSVSTSSTTDLSQASSTNFPLAYPQDPICNNNLMSKYEGGQVSVNPVQRRYYDIECAADYTNPGNNPFGATTQPTYNSCANQCDIAAGQSTPCFAFSWSTSSGLCTLFGRVSNGVQLTTNMTNTPGTHSGRWLATTVGSTTNPQPLQLYLARPIPFPVGPIAANSQTNRDYPGGTNTYFNTWSDTSHATVLDLSSQYGIQWKIFDQVQAKLWVTANFWFTNTPLGVTAATQNQWSAGSRNSDTAPLVFPAGNLPGYTLAPLWTYGHILGASQQGIYYQVDTISTGRYGVSIEWFFSHFGQDNNVFHAVTTYDTGVPGVWSTYFFLSGAASGQNEDQGLRQSVGGQGNPDSFTQFFTYCAARQDCVLPGAKMTMDTTKFDVSQVMNYTAALFNPATYAVGTWTWQTKPCC
ncbi:hypothetical protein AYO20_08469 [Fonsecaea nubica]|uniref:DUF7908 domain-containing protein n=1 Tax=Fonsecaea nubica TaxID=856822 RepID=A0A178CMJ8_9EURO|nr:hypothetical protein AYO20_08469 [Fonsecaea nubica]OAL31048.1 hypothetical protein AYO20_08469 [Fonsecaea nubica]